MKKFLVILHGDIKKMPEMQSSSIKRIKNFLGEISSPNFFTNHVRAIAVRPLGETGGKSEARLEFHCLKC